MSLELNLRDDIQKKFMTILSQYLDTNVFM